MRGGDAWDGPKVLEIVIKWEGKMVIRSDLMEGHIMVCTMSFYWINERGHER